jgi:hypothetical protein
MFGRLDFSHISVAGAYPALRGFWHPHLFAALVAFRYAVVIVTPVLPILAEVPASSAFKVVPILGAFCAGNLTTLWLGFFSVGAPRFSVVDDSGFERLVWGPILCWLLLGAWVAVRVIARIPAWERRAVSAPEAQKGL